MFYCVSPDGQRCFIDLIRLVDTENAGRGALAYLVWREGVEGVADFGGLSTGGFIDGRSRGEESHEGQR